MNIKRFLNRLFRRNDRGEGILGVVVGMAVTALIIGVPVVIVAMGSQTSASSNQLQQQDAELTTVMNRATQNIQVADSILYAAPNELVTRGKTSDLELDADGEYKEPGEEGETEEVITRWVLSEGTFYQQAWENPPAAYSHNWQALTSTEPAANGQGPGIILAEDVKLTDTGIFTYFDRDGKTLGYTGGIIASDKLAEIIRVKINVAAGVLDFGEVENETYVTLRNAQAPSSDYVPEATCPEAAVAADSDGKAKLSWEPVAGASGYRIHRDGVLVASPGSNAKTWTDNAVTESGRVVEYKVLSVVGGVTSDCAPVTYRTSVEAPSPVISVLPAGADASTWLDSGLKKPRISISWDPVVNASGYELYMRQVDPVSGTSNGGFTLVNTDNELATSYTWDDGGWGNRYEWYLHVTSRAGGSADSGRIHTLTNPEAPEGLKASAAYSTGDRARTHGVNTVTWDAVPNASSYELWRYDSGSAGAVKRIATVSATSATDTVEYGTEFTYYVIAKNNGPRGTNASGEAVTQERASAPPEAAAEKKSAKAKQLQFPPIPAIAPVGPAETNSRDEDGTNRVMWSAARSAEGYHIARQNIREGVQVCLTGACKVGSEGVTGNVFREKAARGSQFQYQVMAYNKTGMSRDWSALETLTQRPAAPAFDVTKRPDLSTDRSSFRVAQNADAGNGAANGFCTVGSSTCQYQLTREGRAGVWGSETISTNNDNGGGTIEWANVPNHEGYTSWYVARSKNIAITNGGWSDNSRQEINTYPGRFNVGAFNGDTNGNQRHRMYVDVHANDLQGSDYVGGSPNNARFNGHVGASWTRSMGSYAMRVTRHPVANDTRACRDGLPCEAEPYQVVWHGGADARSDIAAPGATYYFTIRAMGDNGWTRSVDTGHITTPTDIPQFGKVILTCAGDNVIGTKLTEFNARPKYGQWNYGQVAGLRTGYMGAGYTTDHYRQYYNGGAWAGRQSSSNGSSYYYGLTEGFDIQAVGNGGWSARIRQGLVALAPQYYGCAHAGARGDSMIEPTYPCYGYSGGSCQSVALSGRPQWSTR